MTCKHIDTIDGDGRCVRCGYDPSYVKPVVYDPPCEAHGRFGCADCAWEDHLDAMAEGR
jgi:hypothetical protein